MTGSEFVLTLSCSDQPGIVASVSAFLFARGQNILDAQQFGDIETSRFFMRVVFAPTSGQSSLVEMREAISQTVASSFAMTYRLHDRSIPQRVMLLVSRFDHCLVDIIYRWRTGELAMIPAAVVANHPADAYDRVEFGDIPFHFLPTTPTT